MSREQGRGESPVSSVVISTVARALSPMGSVITDASSALAGAAQPRPAVQALVASIAGGARAEVLSARTPHPSE
eukprot:13551419-Alexandrium_andersonii.AAC.1